MLTTVTLTLGVVQGEQAWAAEMTGIWRYSYKTSEVSGFEEVSLRQTGAVITGTYVIDASRGKRAEVCLKGRVDGAAATVSICYTNQGGPGSTLPECPDWSTWNERFTLLHGKLVWYRPSRPDGVPRLFRTLTRIPGRRSRRSPAAGSARAV